MPLTLEELEQRAREKVGLFAKGEPPPTAAQTDPTLFQQFTREAMPYIGYVGAPMGMGLSGVRGPGAMPAPRSAPLSPAGASRYIEPPPMSQPRISGEEALHRLNAALEDPPLSSPSFLRGLTDEQRRLVQRHVDNGMAEFQLRAAVREMQIGNKRAMGGQPSQRQFDINNFREPSPEPPAPHDPSAGGRFIEPPFNPTPRGYAPPSSLTERLSQVPTPPVRQLGSEMPIGEIKKTDYNWSIPYEPGGTQRGGIYAHVDPSDPGALQISSSNLPSSAQGQGIGIEMYQRLIDEAHKQGKIVGSDSLLSNKSYPVYDQALRSRGYNVQRSPYYHRARGQYPNQTDDGSSVFTVGPQEPLPPRSLMGMLGRVPKVSPYSIIGAPLGAPFFREDEQ